MIAASDEGPANLKLAHGLAIPRRFAVIANNAHFHERQGEPLLRDMPVTVLAFEMVNQQQRFQSYGHSAALAVVLFLFVLPLIIFNVRQIRKQRELR